MESEKAILVSDPEIKVERDIDGVDIGLVDIVYHRVHSSTGKNHQTVYGRKLREYEPHHDFIVKAFRFFAWFYNAYSIYFGRNKRYREWKKQAYRGILRRD